MFIIGYLLGRLNAKPTSENGGKINDNVKYSVRWWLEQANVSNVAKTKATAHFYPLVRAGFLEKERTKEGLTIFVPTSKQAKKKAFEVIQALR